MRVFFQSPLRFLRGGFFLFWVLFSQLTVPLDGQLKFRNEPNRQMPGNLAAGSELEVFKRFQANRAIGPFTLEGQLTYRPRSEASLHYAFSMEGEWQQGSERTRLVLYPRASPPEVREVLVGPVEILLLHDADPTGQSGATVLGSDLITTRVFAQMPVTWFDILMPFLHWNEVQYMGPERQLGRPAHRYRLENPDTSGHVHSVVVSIDESFGALLKADLLSADDVVVQRIRVGGFAKFGDLWTISELIWEDRINRDSIRLRVTDFAHRRNH